MHSTFFINGYIGVGNILIGKNPKWLDDRDRSQIDRVSDGRVHH